MSKLVIIGGRLQGVEAAYLAKMAGCECTLVDLNADAPASLLCDRFVQGDATDQSLLKDICSGADLILPAMESLPVLAALEEFSEAAGVPLLYDRDAYAISSSKKKSDRWFAELRIPAPVPWPRCGLPVVSKPTGGSGSQGVAVLRSQDELDKHLANSPGGRPVLQQFLPGPSYSIEVIGNGEEYAALQTTQLFMDRVYDCKRVVAPAGLDSRLEWNFRKMALFIARKLGIKGIFDLEAILHEGEFKVLEIDARLPSQTPTAVYHSTGINMVECLLQTAGGLPPRWQASAKRACLYEHLHIRDGKIEVCGEHIMGQFGPLRMEPGFCGADMAITSRRPGGGQWVATMIYWGETRGELFARRRKVLEDLPLN